jgi:hypothetical protein
MRIGDRELKKQALLMRFSGLVSLDSRGFRGRKNTVVNPKPKSGRREVRLIQLFVLRGR